MFNRILTVPSILTEVSNLCGQVAEPDRSRVLAVLSYCVQLLVERYTPSKQLTHRNPFLRFGLTDTAIEEAARDQVLVLRDDFRLTQYLDSIGVAAITFNHLRFT